MRQTWRWFGPADTVPISAMQQVGVEGIVSALHHIENGEVWSLAEIEKRQQEVAFDQDGQATGVEWEVVESLPVSESIKTKSPDFERHIANYLTSLENLAAAGLKVVCYNFMPVLDWTRTNLRAPMPSGATAMLFDLLDFATFDIHVLSRAGADQDYPENLVSDAEKRFQSFTEENLAQLQRNIVAGLPGANDTWSIDELKTHLQSYANIDADALRQNLIDFLTAVIPVAERLGIRMCCHPDDPPFPLLGLPRIMSTEADFAQIVEAIPSSSNGITLCTGSLGVSSNFDAVGFVERLGTHIHFAHLRNTTRIVPAAGSRTSFYETAHLEGDTDMAAVIAALMAEEHRRKVCGRSDWTIPMRPDHGQDLLYDQDQQGMPGYPLIGRMRGLAELRGIMAGVETLNTV